MRILKSDDLRWVAGGVNSNDSDPFELPPGNPIRDFADMVDGAYGSSASATPDTDGDGDRDMTDEYNFLYAQAVADGYFDPGRIENDPHEDYIESLGVESGIIDAIQGDDNVPGDT